MPTTKSRINVSLSDDALRAIARLAKRDELPDATLAARLIDTALDLEEDVVFDALAAGRDKPGVKFVAHDQAW